MDEQDAEVHHPRGHIGKWGQNNSQAISVSTQQSKLQQQGAQRLSKSSSEHRAASSSEAQGKVGRGFPEASHFWELSGGASFGPNNAHMLRSQVTAKQEICDVLLTCRYHLLESFQLQRFKANKQNSEEVAIYTHTPQEIKRENDPDRQRVKGTY